MRLGQKKKEPITVRRDVKVINELGLHARPAAQFVRNANAFRSEIWLVKDDRRFSARSLIEVLRANLNCGDSAVIEAHGVDAEAAIERLEKLLLEFRDQKDI
jgi:phosphotransferase system HPr (HPr) family protein